MCDTSARMSEPRSAIEYDSGLEDCPTSAECWSDDVQVEKGKQVSECVEGTAPEVKKD